VYPSNQLQPTNTERAAPEMTITEPSTLLTDYLLGTLTAVLAWRLFRQNRERHQLAVNLWALALAVTSAGSFAGGSYHGFRLAMLPETAAALWTITTLLVGIASFFLLSSAVFASFTGSLLQWFLAAAIGKLAVYTWWMIGHNDFRYVIYEYGSTLSIVLLLVALGRVGGEPGVQGHIIAGIVVSIVAGALQQSGIDLHRHFNHNDLQHVVQMVAIWFLYEGGRRLRDAATLT
jgi:hypothetical protein